MGILDDANNIINEYKENMFDELFTDDMELAYSTIVIPVGFACMDRVSKGKGADTSATMKVCTALMSMGYLVNLELGQRSIRRLIVGLCNTHAESKADLDIYARDFFLKNIWKKWLFKASTDTI